MNNSNTSVTAVTANLDVGSGGYINSVTSKHSAQYYIQGTFRPWGEKSLPETRQ